MNITDAKQISIQKLVEQLGGRYSHIDRKGDMWFFSPFRPDEKTASFKTTPKLNTWHDFGLASTNIHRHQGSGGDVIDLWCDYHFKDRRLGIKEALEALSQCHLIRVDEGQQNQWQKPIIQAEPPTFEIVKIFDKISFTGLKDELQRRRITPQLANLYLQQAQIENTVTGKKYWGFVFPNQKAGFEVSIPNPQRGECFKTSIGSKGISYIPSINESTKAHVFEGFWDFLSWMEINKQERPLQHHFILNSNSFAGEAVTAITNRPSPLKYVFLYLDNDKSGVATVHAMALPLEEADLQIASMEGFYKDINEYWTKSPLARAFQMNFS